MRSADRLRESVRTELADGAYPQVVLRLGAIAQAAASVRRAPEEVWYQAGSDDINIGDG